MGITHYGQVDASDGFSVDGTIVIDANGKIIESAGIQLADGDSFDDTNGNEVIEFKVVASAVNQIEIGNSATGVNPTIAANGEADTGITFVNDQDEEILILDSVATSVNELTIASAATGNNPIIKASGEADTGITFMNLGDEEILILNSIATSVNEFTIASAATGSGPQLEATGGDTNVSIELIPKGTGNVTIQGARGIDSSISNAIVPFFISAAQQALSGAGAIDITSTHTNWTTTAADAGTLVDSTLVGQFKRIQLIVDGGDGTLTPTTLNGGTTITFADAGDTAELLWDGSGWQVIALYNMADGATAPVLA